MLDGTTLKRIRLLNKKTQVQCADAVGCSERYIKMIENNQANFSEEMYDAYLDFCYHGTISERAKRKKAEEEAKRKAELAEAEKPKRKSRDR